jgi:hypothetical protein
MKVTIKQFSKDKQPIVLERVTGLIVTNGSVTYVKAGQTHKFHGAFEILAITDLPNAQ